MKEKDIQSKLRVPFIKYMKEHNGLEGIFELKLSKNKAKTVAWSKFEDQQLPSLYKAKHEGLYWKLSDMDIRRKPADFFCVNNGYVALCYYVPHQPKLVYFLDIDDVYVLKNTPKKRSIHLDDAIRLAKFIIKV